MAVSNFLATELVGANQNNKFQTINDAIAQAERATNRALAVDLTSVDVDLTLVQQTENLYFKCSGHTVARTLGILLDAGNGANTAERLFIVENAGTSAGALTIDSPSAGFGTGVVIPIGITAILHSDGTNIEVVMSTAGSWLDLADTPLTYTGQAFQIPRVNSGETAIEFIDHSHDFGAQYAGTPPISSTINKFVAGRAFTIPANMTGSQAHVGTAPSSAIAIDVQNNGGSIGTISFAASAFTATFVTAGGTAKNIAAGDVITMVTPVNLFTSADFSFTIVGARGDASGTVADAQMVTAAAVITDHAIPRGNGGARALQDSGLIIDDTDNLSGALSVSADDIVAVAAANPHLRAAEAASATSYGELENTSTTQSKLRHVALTGVAELNIECEPGDGTSEALVQFFRDTVTTGAVGIEVNVGDGTATIVHRLASGGGESYFGSDAQNIGFAGVTNPVCGVDSATPIRPGTYTVATVPTASAMPGAMIYVSDEAGGAVTAFSDGTNWRRHQDRAIVA